ncbi:MAG: hypothetical protein ACKOHG_11915, partial [Planctomycetia bacterium]
MKLRSLVLMSCMLIVPSLAMFSHLIPPDYRAAVRRQVASATHRWLDRSAKEVAAAPAPAPALAPAAPV